MKQIIRIVFYITSIAFVTGCSKDGAEDIPINGILIEMEAPRTSGWSTEENISTRSHHTEISKQKGEDGLDMEISTQPEFTDISREKATTRWTNMDDNITFRVVAYKSATAAGISTSNYAGYGDYKLSGSTVQTNKNLVIPKGTYTFICYSYGNATAMAPFANSSTSVSASNGQNFMTCVKPGVTINNTGSTYTLGNIVFEHHCVRYRILAKAEVGRMGNITACNGTLTLPKHNATYTFTNNAFTVQATSGTVNVNVTWSNPNAMNVYSNYIYMLPQSSASITVKLNPTIGGKAFTNKNATLSGLTLTSNKTYCSSISFTTTQGYIVRGSFWARGNLYYNNNKFDFYGTTIESSTNRSLDFWRWDALHPSDVFGDSPAVWNSARDPCRQISNWRLPTKQEFASLLQGSATYTTMNGKNGVRFDNILFLPCTGYFSGHNLNGSWGEAGRGLYWSQNRVGAYGSMLDFNIASYAPLFNNSNHPDNAWPIRCVRAD